MQNTQSRTTIWRIGDEPGNRQFAGIGNLKTERGAIIPDVQVAYEMYGKLNAQKSNAILVLHGFTGDSHAAGRKGPGHIGDGWWNAIIGPGKALDTDRFCVVVPNVLGGCQGTTGPGSLDSDAKPWGSRFPKITIRDMVETERKLIDALDIEKLHGVVGVSLGGQRGVEWGVQHSERIGSLVIIGSNAVASAEQIATQSIQLELIRNDPSFHKGDYYNVGDGSGPQVGMASARRVGHMTYRTAEELERRFANQTQGTDDPFSENAQFAVTSYLDHMASKLAARFDPNTYIAINEAMCSHDVGRGHGRGVEGTLAALTQIDTHVVVVSIDQDRLYPPYQQKFLEKHIANARLRKMSAIQGHDAFLTNDADIALILRETFPTIPMSMRQPDFTPVNSVFDAATLALHA